MFKKTFLLIAIITPALISAQNSYNNAFSRLDRLREDQQTEEAKALADSLLAVIDPIKEGPLYLKINIKLIAINVDRGSFSEGVKVGDQFLHQYAPLLDINKRLACEFYVNIGNAYHLTQSNTVKAYSYLQQAKSLFDELHLPDPKLELTLLKTLAGNYYYSEKYIEAIDLQKRALELIPAKDKTTIALTHRSIGNCYWGIRDYTNAAIHYQKGLDALYSQSSIDSLTIGRVLHAKGYIHMDQEDSKTAYETFVSASNLLKGKHPEVSSPMVWVYGDVGRALIKLEKYDSALIWLQKALNANVFEFKQDDIYKNPPLVSLNDDFQHFMILKLKGQAFFKKYLLTKEEKDLEGMLDCFNQADQQVDNIRKTIPKAEDQATITYYSTELYIQAIDALAEAYTLQQERKFLDLAHYFMEKRKITQVHLKFLEATAKSNNLLPEHILLLDRQYIDRVDSLKSKLRALQSTKHDSVEVIQKTLFEIQEEYEKFIEQLKTQYPAYHTSRFDLKISSLDDVQKYLNKYDPTRAIITYFNFRNKLRTSYISKDTAAIWVNAHDVDIESLSNKFRSHLTSTELEDIQSNTISTLLLGDLDGFLNDNITSLTVIADPSFQLIPIELLQLNNRMLFESYDISYHFSATMFQTQNRSKYNPDGFLGFAPSFDSISLASLPGAKTELMSISSVYGGETFIGNEANERDFKKRMAKSGLIHLATHAIIDEQNPESSYMQFSPSDSIDDGRLYFFEIYNLNLNAQLVTLSACNTGYGKIQKGEGVMSLSRAFAYAGVPSSVVSLWPASDKSTPKLMKYFYQNLKEGQAKDVALNNARKQYLATAQGKARHPFYWGGFVLIGDNSPIEEDTNLLVYVIPTVLVLVMILTIYRRRKSRA